MFDPHTSAMTRPNSKFDRNEENNACVDPISHLLRARGENTPTSSNMGWRSLPFQRWIKFKEAYSPEFVRHAIQTSPYRPAHCIDPFGGSGTTALTCSLLGVDSTTIEVNPFLADLIRAKLNIISNKKIKEVFYHIASTVSETDPKTDEFCRDAPKSFCEPGEKGRYIYRRPVLDQILRWRNAIETVADSDVRRVLKIALASTLIFLSNIVVNGKGRRYRGGWTNRQLTGAQVDQTVAEAVERFCEDIEGFSRFARARTKVITADCRGTQLPSHDLAIFSPPYPNSFDYTDVYNIELWILGYLKGSDDNRDLRQSTLQSHVQVNRNWRNEPRLTNIPTETYDELVNRRPYLWDPRIPEMVRAYFQDMSSVFGVIAQSLVSGGRLVAAVGDSRYAGVHIRVAEALADEAACYGLKLINVERIRSMRSSAQDGGQYELKECAITLEK